MGGIFQNVNYHGLFCRILSIFVTYLCQKRGYDRIIVIRRTIFFSGGYEFVRFSETSRSGERRRRVPVHAGRAVVSVNVEEHAIECDTEVVLLPDMVFMLVEASADFRVIFYASSIQVFDGAMQRLDTECFHYLETHPAIRHRGETARGVKTFIPWYWPPARRRRTSTVRRSCTC